MGGKFVAVGADEAGSLAASGVDAASGAPARVSSTSTVCATEVPDVSSDVSCETGATFGILQANTASIIAMAMMEK